MEFYTLSGLAGISFRFFLKGWGYFLIKIQKVPDTFLFKKGGGGVFGENSKSTWVLFFQNWGWGGVFSEIRKVPGHFFDDFLVRGVGRGHRAQFSKSTPMCRQIST